MKKFLLTLVMMVTLVGCGSETNEDRIEAAFKDYAYKNLDNPKNLKGITEISCIETYNTQDTKKDLEQIVAQFDSINNAQDAAAKELVSTLFSLPKQQVNKLFADEEFRTEFVAFKSAIETQATDILYGRWHPAILPNYISQFNDTTINVYEVKYRFFENGNLKLHKAYAVTNPNCEIVEFFDNKENVVFNDSIMRFISTASNFIKQIDHQQTIAIMEIRRIHKLRSQY